MKFLLTSGGISNLSIADTHSSSSLGKPIAESTALIVPTAIYPFPGGPAMAWKAISGKASLALAELGWKSLGVLELSALPTIREEHWVAAVQEADALLVWGGDVLYLTYWMRQSGLAESAAIADRHGLRGVSAGSIAVTPHNCDAEFDLQFVPDGSDMGKEAETGLGLVDFTLYPHLNHPEMPHTTLANMEKWASGIPAPTYAMDDDTAIKVIDGIPTVVSEGNWRLFNA